MSEDERFIDDAEALDRIAKVLDAGMPDGLRAMTEALEEIQRLARLAGRRSGRRYEDSPTDD